MHSPICVSRLPMDGRCSCCCTHTRRLDFVNGSHLLPQNRQTLPVTKLSLYMEMLDLALCNCSSFSRWLPLPTFCHYIIPFRWLSFNSFLPFVLRMSHFPRALSTNLESKLEENEFQEPKLGRPRKTGPATNPNPCLFLCATKIHPNTQVLQCTFLIISAKTRHDSSCLAGEVISACKSMRLHPEKESSEGLQGDRV